MHERSWSWKPGFGLTHTRRSWMLRHCARERKRLQKPAESLISRLHIWFMCFDVNRARLHHHRERQYFWSYKWKLKSNQLPHECEASSQCVFFQWWFALKNVLDIICEQARITYVFYFLWAYMRTWTDFSFSVFVICISSQFLVYAKFIFLGWLYIHYITNYVGIFESYFLFHFGKSIYIPCHFSELEWSFHMQKCNVSRARVLFSSLPSYLVCFL